MGTHRDVARGRMAAPDQQPIRQGRGKKGKSPGAPGALRYNGEVTSSEARKRAVVPSSFFPLSSPKRRFVMQIRGKTIRTIWLGAGAVAVLLIVIGLIASQGGSVLGQSFSIGYVDMQRALDNHPRKASSERALQEFFQAKQRGFQERVKSLGPVQRQELDRQLQQEFVQKREELLGGLDKDIRVAVEKVSRDRGGSIVLDRTVVLYGGVDLTDAVIAQLTAK